MYKLGPSLMCADLANLERDIHELDEAGVDFFHLDIMDGQFAPNFTFGPDLVKRIRALTDTKLDVHLMVKEPERYIDLFADCGVDMISVHAEATDNLQGTLTSIQDKNIKSGVAINPATSLDFFDYVYDVVDYVVIMTVNPGFAGQKFIPAMYEKISEMKDKIASYGRNIEIQVDGNIGENTIPTCKANGASMYVLGTSAVFNKEHSLKGNMDQTREFFK